MLRTLLFIAALLAGCSGPPVRPLAATHPASADGPTGMVVAPRAVAIVQPPAQPMAHGEHRTASPPQPAPAPADALDQALYMCPMHPEVTSTDPNARCPECGMRINKRIEAEDPS